jgi:hypothetical protein
MSREQIHNVRHVWIAKVVQDYSEGGKKYKVNCKFGYKATAFSGFKTFKDLFCGAVYVIYCMCLSPLVLSLRFDCSNMRHACWARDIYNIKLTDRSYPVYM